MKNCRQSFENHLLNLTISHQLKQTAKRLPDKPAFLFPDENLCLTFAEARHRARKTAKALLALGLEHGDRIGIWSLNCSKWIDLIFGAAEIGVTVVPANTCWQSAELHDLCIRARLKALFVMSRFRGESCAALTRRFIPGSAAGSQYPDLKAVISLDETDPGPHTGWTDFHQQAGSVSDAQLEQAAGKVSVSDIHIIQYTSGTTAKPKGAMLSQYGVMNTAGAYARLLHLSEKDTTCVPLPLFHCFGNVLTLLGGIISAGTTAYLGRVSAKSMLDTLQREQCTTFMGVPTMYSMMLNFPQRKDYDLHALVKAGIGGAYCPAKLSQRITKELAIEGLVIGYGLSEAASLCTLSDISDPPKARLESVGRPLPGLEVSLADAEGKENASIQKGELLIRGYGVMKGYFDDTAETEKALDTEGWLHTGDLGIRSTDGTFQVCGRIKDIIIRGGENISPSDIEEKLMAMDNVADCQCVGVPDPKYGEEIAAFLISKNGRDISAEEVKNYLQARISFYKIPRYVLMTHAFPLNGSGKVLKTILVKEAIERLDLTADHGPENRS